MNVAVNFLTYTPTMEHPRVQYAQQCLTSLCRNLSFKEGDLIWHIADDGSPPEHVAALIEIIRRYAGKDPTVSITEHLGYGGNMNLATQTIHSLAQMVMPIEEDWELVRKFDISDLVKAIARGRYASDSITTPEMARDRDQIDCVRLGYLGWTNDINGRLVQTAGQTFFLMDPDSPETHVFAGHPRIETVAFEKFVGAWPVGIKAGFTEMEICNRRNARMGVAWPLDADINASQDYCRLFAHVGETQA